MGDLFSEQYKIGLTDGGLDKLIAMSEVHHAIFDLVRGQAVAVEFFITECSPKEFCDYDTKIKKYSYCKLTLVQRDDKFDATLELSSLYRQEDIVSVKPLADIIRFLDNNKESLTFFYDDGKIPAYYL